MVNFTTRELQTLSRDYGLDRMPDGRFESTRRIYEAADVKAAMASGFSGMTDLKAKGRTKGGA